MLNTTELFQKLLPELTKLESERKKLTDKVYEFKFAYICLISAALGIVFFLFTSAENFNKTIFIPLGVVFFIILTIVYWFQNQMEEKFRVRFKFIIIGGLLKTIAPQLQYHPKEHIPKDTFKASRLFNRSIDTYTGEDFIYGQLDKTVFQLSEVKAKEKYKKLDKKGKEKNRYSLVFKGLFMVADFNKNFQGQTFVLPDQTEKKLGTWVSKKIQSLDFGRGTLIQMEDPDFEKTFKVYTSDVVEARYILSPKLMRDILSLQDKFSCRIYLSFLQSNIYIGMSTKHNFMEINLKNSLLEQKTIVSLFESIYACVNIVEDLNLNTRIWSKQAY